MFLKFKSVLIPSGLFLFFSCIYLFVSPYHQGGYTIGYSDFPILVDKMSTAGGGFGDFGPAIQRMMKESAGGKTVDLYIGHQLYIPLTLLSYAAARLLGGHNFYHIAGAILTALLSAAGIVLFYEILRIAGKAMKDRLFGVLFLGFSWYYSQNAHNNDSGIYAALSILIVILAYLRLLDRKPVVWKMALFWLCFSAASLFYMNTVILGAVIVIFFAWHNRTVKDIALCILSGLVVGFGSLYFFTSVIMKWLSSLGIYVVSTDLFDLLAYYGLLMKAYIFVNSTPLYTVPVVLCRKIGELFFPPYQNVLAFAAGIVTFYFIGLVSAYLFRRGEADRTYRFFFSVFAGYLAYFIITKYMFFSRIYMACIVPISYLVTESFSLARLGRFPAWFRPRLVQRALAGCVLLFISLYGIYAYAPALLFGETFYTFPSADKKLFEKRFFEFIGKNTEPNALIIYDSGYIDRTIGSMLLLYSDRFSLINYTPNIVFLGGFRGVNSVAAIRPDVPLSEVCEGRGKSPVYLLSTCVGIDRIAVPSDEYLGSYYLFVRKASFYKWGLFSLDEKAKLTQDDISRAVAGENRCVSINPGKKYRKQDLHWEMLSLGGLRGQTLVLVQTREGAEVDTKERYLCYW